MNDHGCFACLALWLALAILATTTCYLATGVWFARLVGRRNGVSPTARNADSVFCRGFLTASVFVWPVFVVVWLVCLSLYSLHKAVNTTE